MKGILISLPLEFPPVCCGLHGATAGSCSWATCTYFPTFLLVFLDIPKQQQQKKKLNQAEKLPLCFRHVSFFPSFVSALVADDLAR